MQPVSVIIPTYNREKYIERAIFSVINQVHFKGEIIVIDDGSTDATRSIVHSIVQTVPIRYIFISNSGPSIARNTGVKNAQHEYIAFLDSDDHWHKGKISLQMKALEENPDYLICHTGEKWLRRGKHLNKKNKHYPRSGYIFDHCLQLCGVGMSTVVMKKSLFEDFDGFDPDLPCCEDYDLWLRISATHHFLLINEPLITKEGGRDDQLSAKYRVGMDKFRIHSLEKVLKSGKLSITQFNTAFEELQKKCSVYGRGCLKHGREKEGLHYLSIPTKYC